MGEKIEERKGYIYLNEVKITGRLTDKVNYTEFEKGGGVAEFTIAHNRRWKSKEDDNWKEITSFFKVKAYNELAEKVKEKLKKGDFVLVEGRLQEESWENGEGQKRSLIKIVAEKVHLVFPYQKKEEEEANEKPEKKEKEKKSKGKKEKKEGGEEK